MKTTVPAKCPKCKSTHIYEVAKDENTYTVVWACYDCGHIWRIST